MKTSGDRVVPLDPLHPDASTPPARAVPSAPLSNIDRFTLVPPACGTWTNGMTKRQALSHADCTLTVKTEGRVWPLSWQICGVLRGSVVCDAVLRQLYLCVVILLCKCIPALG